MIKIKKIAKKNIETTPVISHRENYAFSALSNSENIVKDRSQNNKKTHNPDEFFLKKC